MKTLLSLFTHRIISSRNFPLLHYSGALQKGITYDPFVLLLTLEHNLFQEFRYWGTVGRNGAFSLRCPSYLKAWDRPVH